jgi:hypothetical protein
MRRDRFDIQRPVQNRSGDDIQFSGKVGKVTNKGNGIDKTIFGTISISRMEVNSNHPLRKMEGLI